MAAYKLTTGGVILTATATFVPNQIGNRHWAEYQQWLADGGVPDPADVLSISDLRSIALARLDVRGEEKRAAVVGAKSPANAYALAHLEHVAGRASKREKTGALYEWIDVDFHQITGTLNTPFTGAAIGTGGIASATLPAAAIDAELPGAITLQSSGNANSGYMHRGAIDLRGGKGLVVQVTLVHATLGTCKVWAGLSSQSDHNLPTNGVGVYVDGATRAAVARDNGTPTTSSTDTAVVDTKVTYQLEYIEDDAVLVLGWEGRDGDEIFEHVLDSNVPNAANRLMRPGIWAWNSGAAATDIVAVDRIRVGRRVDLDDYSSLDALIGELGANRREVAEAIVEAAATRRAALGAIDGVLSTGRVAIAAAADGAAVNAAYDAAVAALGAL